MSAPAAATADIALRDGSALRLRPARRSDAPALLAFFSGLGGEDLQLRFFTAGADLRRAACEAAETDGPDRVDLVAVADDDEEVLAHGCLVRTGAHTGEVAFAVAGRLRGQGVATAMLAHLAHAARAVGILRLEAVVLPENAAMIDVFRESGLEPEIRVGGGEVRVSMPAEMGSGAQRRYDERDAEAAAAAVSHVLRPHSVAVLGASGRAGSIGGAVLRNIVEAGFTGAVHAVNPRAGIVAGVPAVTRLGDVAGPVELAVVAVPAAAVLEAASDCARHGVRALVVISDGFGEAGREGRRRQHELLDVCRRNGMRLVGPNCLGVLCTDPEVRLDATFAPRRPPPGRIGFLSQSGALGIAAIDAARERGLGLSSFASVGDKADLSGNDFLAYWEGDQATDVILLYLESFGNPRRFSRVARHVARSKPIVVVKGGRSPAGAQAAGSHTGALLAASDATVQALFRRAGVIPVDTLGELFDVAELLTRGRPPRGPRVGIVTNGGGLGILCADACAAAGLDLVALSDDANPLDLRAAAGPDDFQRAIARIGASGAVDAIIAIFVPTAVTDSDAVVAAIAAGAAGAGVPVASVLTMPGTVTHPALATYRFPEEAARAVGRAARYGAWLEEPPDEPPVRLADADPAAAAAILARGTGWLEPEAVAGLLDAYGIPRPAQRVVATAAEAADAARQLGGVVALKAVAPGLVHRSDAGAVTTGLTGRAAVLRAARAMRERLAAAGTPPTGFLVQAMAAPGVELLAGVAADPLFGPVVACAAGGTAAELLGDTAVTLAPLAHAQAMSLVRSLRTFPLLDGFRGAPPCDVDAVADVLVRLAALADAHPEVAELECNPVIVGPGGAVVVDARVRVQAPPSVAAEPALRPA